MVRRATMVLGVWILVLLFATPANAGGWAVVTLDSLPKEVRANEPLSLSFMVRQHGQTPNSNVTPFLTARHAESGKTLRVEAREGKEVGRFILDVTFPSEGTWEWSIVPEPFEGTDFAPLSVLPATAAASQPNTSLQALSLAVPLRLAGAALVLAAVALLVSRRGVRVPGRVPQA